MATAMILISYINETLKLPTSAVLALIIAYCGVVFLSVGGRAAMVGYMKVEGRRFFLACCSRKDSRCIRLHSYYFIVASYFYLACSKT